MLCMLAEAVISDEFRYMNFAEAGVWVVVGVLAWKAARDRAHPRAAVVLLMTLLTFGASDVVETTTGAWWRPWWLFVWKAACVAVIVATLVTLWVTRKPAPTPSDRRAEA